MGLFSKKSNKEKELTEDLKTTLSALQIEILTRNAKLYKFKNVTRTIKDIYSNRGASKDLLKVIKNCDTAMDILKETAKASNARLFQSAYLSNPKLHKSLYNILALQLSLYNPDSTDPKTTEIKEKIKIINIALQKEFAPKTQKKINDYTDKLNELANKMNENKDNQEGNFYKIAIDKKNDILKKSYYTLKGKNIEEAKLVKYKNIEDYCNFDGAKVVVDAEIDEKINKEFDKIDAETKKNISEAKKEQTQLNKDKQQLFEDVKKACTEVISSLNYIKETATEIVEKASSKDDLKSYQSIMTSLKGNKSKLEAENWDARIDGCESVIKGLGKSLTGVRKIIRENFGITLKILEKEKEVEDIRIKFPELDGPFFDIYSTDPPTFIRKKELEKYKKELEKHKKELASLKKKYKINQTIIFE